MYGIREFTAIINMPQVSILAVGGSQDSVYMRPDLTTLHEVTLTLSTDSRYVDQIVAGYFLSYVSRLLGDYPEELIDKVDANTFDPFSQEMLLGAAQAANSAS
ncbi:unnamed protein product [Protopolystoma xenopodis]|uniref:2-oxoacid dehydrogenase acyltransferase catalytic domain-containing protein n=1 Tax=Protopolystoma xenopodis TaxID=117903 RepID=A0A3S4ZXC4_9PLAT|nr:unnamed protein product [Protopolystoma xenopodis]